MDIKNHVILGIAAVLIYTYAEMVHTKPRNEPDSAPIGQALDETTAVSVKSPVIHIPLDHYWDNFNSDAVLDEPQDLHDKHDKAARKR
jgi:hypothetical protein